MSRPPRILSFDTSGPHCAAALMIGGQIVALDYEEMGRGQAERLFPMLEEILKEAGAVWEELDAIAVGTGPGNFTGIRIAVSAARGLALSLGIPAIGVTGFEALRGSRFHGDPAKMIVSLPASRRGADIVLQYFENGEAVGGPVELTIFGRGVLGEEFKGFPGPAQILGHEAAAVNYAVQLDKGNYTYLEFGPGYPISRAIAEVAALKFLSEHEFPRPSPLYIRPADAAPASDPPPLILP
jgi:tRNA threonylcarbamoyladenosine biosynthesis protein TsaB